MHDLPPESMIKNWVKIPADSHSKCALIDRIKLNSDILPSWHLISTGYYLLDIWMIHIKNRKKTSTTLTAFVSSKYMCKMAIVFLFSGFFFFFTQPSNKLFWNTHGYAIRWQYILNREKNCKKWHNKAHIGL